MAAFPTVNPDPEFNTVLSGPPVATRRFRPSDIVISFVEVYEGPSPTPRAINFVWTVQSATDGRTVFSAREQRPIEASSRAQGHGFRTEVPLKTLIPGTYVLGTGATVGDRTARREVLF